MRREALRAAVARRAPDLARRLDAALLDPAPSLRHFARVHLAPARPPGFADVYRRRLADLTARPASEVKPADLATAVAGVGETGGAGDVPAVVPLVRHPSARVARSAIRAAAALAARAATRTAAPGSDDAATVAATDALLDTLSDGRPGVCRAARSALLALPPVPADRLWSAFASAGDGGTPPPHARAAVLSLANDQPGWATLSLLLRAAASGDGRSGGGPGDAAVRDAAAAELRRWHARAFRWVSPPTAAERSRAAADLASAAPRLPPDLAASLALLIRGA